MSLPALTVQRPWPWAIFHCPTSPKRVENRGWKPPRGLLGKHFAIHAGKVFDEDAAETLSITYDCEVPPANEHPAGAIVGVVRLVAVVEGEASIFVGRTPHRMDVVAGTLPAAFDTRWFVGPIGWVLDEVTAIEPVACRGAQGLWTVPDAELAIVRARWKAARTNVPTVDGLTVANVGGAL